MSVATEACFPGPLDWTGVETAFNAGFTAYSASQVHVTFRDAAGSETELTQGLHYTVSIAGSPGLVTIAVVSFPPAPGKVPIWRETEAVQGTDFVDLASFPAATHTRLHDLAAMRGAETHRDLARTIRARLDETLLPLPAVLARKSKFAIFDGDGNLSYSSLGVAQNPLAP